MATSGFTDEYDFPTDRRFFVSDPSRKFDYLITFSSNFLEKGGSFAKGLATKVTGLDVKFQRYEIKEGGNLATICVPVRRNPIVVTFEGLLVREFDQSKHLRHLLNQLAKYNTTGSLFFASGSLSWDRGIAFNCLIRRVASFDTAGGWSTSAGGSSFGGDSWQYVNLLHGYAEGINLVDEISTGDAVAYEKMTVVFQGIELHD